MWRSSYWLVLRLFRTEGVARFAHATRPTPQDNIRREAMRIRVLLLALLLASALLPIAPAQACPAGYRMCGNYCCR
jgi:hypothetical protein